MGLIDLPTPTVSPVCSDDENPEDIIFNSIVKGATANITIFGSKKKKFIGYLEEFKDSSEQFSKSLQSIIDEFSRDNNDDKIIFVALSKINLALSIQHPGAIAMIYISEDRSVTVASMEADVARLLISLICEL